MTTWHGREQIEDALWFSVYNSFTDPVYEGTCRVGVAATIGSEEWDDLSPNKPLQRSGSDKVQGRGRRDALLNQSAAKRDH
jgi:hypothetical protein